MKPWMLSALLVVGGAVLGYFLRDATAETSKGSGAAQSSSPAMHETVLCKRGQGEGGEYGHFRRKTEGLDYAACEDVLKAYASAYRITDLYCSKTPKCPEGVY